MVCQGPVEHRPLGMARPIGLGTLDGRRGLHSKEGRRIRRPPACGRTATKNLDLLYSSAWTEVERDLVETFFGVFDANSLPEDDVPQTLRTAAESATEVESKHPNRCPYSRPV